MKNLRVLGVLLVSLIFPIVVNADTAVINDAEALEACVKTSDVCQINKDIVVEDAIFDSGTIEIPAEKTLTIKGNGEISESESNTENHVLTNYETGTLNINHATIKSCVVNFGRNT